MSNVLINCISAGSGGALTYLINLVPKLVEKSKNSDLKIYLLLKKNQYDLIGQDLSDNVIYAPELGGYKRFIWEYLNLPKIVDEHNIDLVYTPYQIARIIKNTKNIVMFRNMEPFTFHKYKNTYKNWLRNFLLKKKTINTIANADKVIAVSGYVKEVILNNAITTEDKITKIYHGRNNAFTADIKVDDSSVLAHLNIDSDYIFTCGSLFPYRKCEDVIQAYADLENRSALLVIAGTGNDMPYLKKLTSLIESHGLSENVLMLGHVSLEQMTVLYRNCKLFVTATETEACPNIAIEAMSSGCTILSSDIMPLPEIFKTAATYFHHGDITQLSDIMSAMLAKDSVVNNEALSLIESFTWDKCADETYELLLTTVNS